MSEPVLPQDLLDEITASVALVDPRTLGKLALTSKLHFLHQAQSHQFRELTIFQEMRWWGKYVLDNKPSLFKHVRSLRVRLDIEPPSHESCGGCGKVHKSGLQAPLRVLSHVSGPVESLDLSVGSRGPRGPRTWEEISKDNPYLVELVDRLFQYPLTSLTLHLYPVLDFPASFLRSLPLHSVTFQGHGHMAAFRVGRQRRLGIERVGEGQRTGGGAVGIPGYLGMLMRNPDEGGLGVIRVLIEPEDALDFRLVHLKLYNNDVATHKIIWSLIEDLGSCSRNTLESMNLSYNFWRTESEEQWLEDVLKTKPTLPHFPLLRNFQISVTVTKEIPLSFEVLNVPSFLPTFLSTILGTNTQPSLESLTMGLQWALHGDPREYLTTPLDKPQRRWGRLDSILSNTALYPRLRTVNLSAKGFLARNSLHGESMREDYRVQYAVYERNLLDCAVGLRKTMARPGMVEDAIAIGQ